MQELLGGKSTLYTEAAELSCCSPGVVRDGGPRESTCSRIHKANAKTTEKAIRAEIQRKANKGDDFEHLDPAVFWLFGFTGVLSQSPWKQSL